MRILICTADGGGNVPPTVAIATELLARGHTARILAGPYYPGQPRSEVLETAFSSAGCEVVSPNAGAWANAAGAFPDIGAIPEYLMMSRSIAMWMPMSVPWATQTRKEIESFHPDVVLADLTVPGAVIAAEAVGIPRIMLETTVPVHRVYPGLPAPGGGAKPGDKDPYREEFIRVTSELSLPHLNAARELVGLPPDDDAWAWEDRADRVIVLSSRAFDYSTASLPANVVYAGTVRPPRRDAWDSPWEDLGERPLIVVSGTTTGLSGLWFAVFQAAANAILELGMRGVLTIGSLDPKTLPQDDSLLYRDFVPHSAVLPEASAMVTQCGHGATIAALRHGLPLVCAPVFADQPDIAARVAYHGAGIALTTLSSEGEFRDAIEAVVGQPRYREAAVVLRNGMAAEDGVSTTAGIVEEVGGGKIAAATPAYGR